MSIKTVLIILLVTFGLQEIWVINDRLHLVTDEPVAHALYSNVMMSWETFIFLGMKYMTLCVYIALLIFWQAKTRAEKIIIGIVLFFQVVEFIDFFITYNAAWFYFLGFPIHASLVKIFVTHALYLSCRKM